MHPIIARLNTLLESGFDCTDIRSDDERIEVELCQGETLLTLVLDRQDAHEILLCSEPRVALVTKKKSFLVRGPVR